MAPDRKYVVLMAVTGLVFSLCSVVGNIAANAVPGLLPAKWNAYLPYTIPLFIFLTILGIVVSIIQFRIQRSDEKSPIGTLSKSAVAEYFQYLVNALRRVSSESDVQSGENRNLVTTINEKTDQSPQNAGISQEVLAVLSKMGILDSTSKLSGSKFEPAECMRQAKRKLHFMGILGSKWVTEPRVRDEFRSLLTRIQAQSGSVHFLLINPRGKNFRQLKNLRKGNISDESLSHFKVLLREFPCLAVRLYDQMPCFRIILIDDKILALSRYKIDDKGYFQSRFGWDAPHLVIDADAPWSLFDAFELLYRQIWDQSEDLLHPNKKVGGRNKNEPQ